MALLSRKEFAAMCHTTPAIVTTNINRDKVILDGKKIDTEAPVNKQFFEKYADKSKQSLKSIPSAKDISKLYEKTVQTLEKQAAIEVNTTAATKKKNKDYKEQRESVNWDGRKKKADALLKEHQAEIALLKVRKMYGEMLPTDFIETMFSSFTKTVFTTLHDSMSNLSGVYCDELAGGDREALGRVNQRLDEVLQDIIDDAQKIAKKDLKNVIKEYSVKKGKGESD